MITAQPTVPSTASAAPRLAPPAAARRSLVGIVIVLAIVAGVFFRLYHIDRKVYWEDETYTSLHVLGLTEADVVRQWARYRDAAALNRVLHPALPLTTSAADTVHSLAAEDAEHPPLYYVLGHYWVALFGDSVVAIRALSVAIGIAALPAMYWLCIELFGSRAAAAIGVALFAVSPIAVLFSQEAREYMLWTLAVILMSAALLRALRLGSLAAWTQYALAVAASLYVYPVSGVLAAGNLAVVALTRRDAGPSLRSAGAATAAAFTAFVPWLALVLWNHGGVGASTGVTLALRAPSLALVGQLAGLVKLDDLDLNLGAQNAFVACVSLAGVALAAYALVHVARRAPRQTWTFIAVLAAASIVPFALPDLLFGQAFTANPRYFMPLYLALDLALVFLFSSYLRPTPSRRKQRRGWALVLGAVIVARIASCAVSANAETWWNKLGERSIDVARTINAAPHPLLLSAESIERPLSLSNYLDPAIPLQLRPRCTVCSGGAGAAFDTAALRRSDTPRTVFVLGASARTQQAVQAAIGSRRRSMYRCIADRLDPQNACSSAALALWDH